ncbi:MAG TPA: CHAT domain-containing tetratricopeptide repeat protein [Bryobacteraceae bacterium]|nr:CHAT domain-containing tetratricopeptide repeat protein [Bryobacteraceae bacterium]
MRCVALAALLFAGCQRGMPPVTKNLSTAKEWLHTEQFGQVLSHADEWLIQAQGSDDIRALWRLRLAKIEALVGQEQPAERIAVVMNRWGDMPRGDDWAADRARWLLARARVAYSTGDHTEAARFLDRSSEAAKSAGRPDIGAEVELRRAIFIHDDGRLPEAERAYEMVIAEARRLNDRSLEAKAANGLGSLLLDQSHHDEAIPVLEHSRTLARDAGLIDSAARAEGNLGYCYYRLGDYENAREHLLQAQSEFESNGNLYEVQIWKGNLGNVFYSTGDLANARTYYGEALRTARAINAQRWVGRWLNNLATMAIDKGDWTTAEQYNNEALRLKVLNKDSRYHASSLNNAAEIAAGKGDPDRARELFHEALRENSEAPTVVVEAHAGLAGLYAAAARPADADAEFRDTLDEIDRRQSKLFKDDYRLEWLDSLISFYQKYVEFLMAQNQPERALEAADASRSKVLIGEAAPRLSASGYRQLAQRSRAVLLEYWLAPKHSYLWLVTPTKIYCYTLPAEIEILSLLRTYRAVVSAGRNPLNVADTTGRALYNTLLAPAVADAGGKADFIVVPDGDLYSVNFETLPDGVHSDRYWIESATIRISPSLNYLASNAPRPGKPGRSGLLLIGNPNPALPQYPKLEFAGNEISEIASAMFAAHPTILQEASATPESYSAAQPGEFGFIHFSAHAAAAAVRESALDSAVILSGPPDKCRLLARDVARIPLNARLVTVSACRSAGSRTYGGEGLVGFAWAFMKAGAGNVIAGLWDVNDQSTVRLMGNLYSGLAKGQREADALRAAKLALIHAGGSYAKPFYWAPFELYTARPE